MKTNNQHRESYIDFIKFIGSILLILAHVRAPNYIIQLRDFDVVLMVLISGYLGKKSLDRNVNSSFRYYEYVFKRFKRLVLPTWFFLIFIFGVLLIIGVPLDFQIILKAFLFQRDSSIVGYVWVIWVYFACSIMLPILYKYNSKCFLIFGIIIYLVYEYLTYQNFLVESRVIYYTLFTFIPYGFITLMGMNYENFSKKNRVIIIISSLITWLVLSIYYFYQHGDFQLTNLYKYPIETYYLSYGIGISFVLFEIFRNKNLKIYYNRVVVFVSKSSLWVYLWHIFYINIFTYVLTIEHWTLLFICVLFMSIFTTFCQNIIVNKLDKLTKTNMTGYLNIFRG